MPVGFWSSKFDYGLVRHSFLDVLGRFGILCSLSSFTALAAFGFVSRAVNQNATTNLLLSQTYQTHMVEMRPRVMFCAASSYNYAMCTLSHVVGMTAKLACILHAWDPATPIAIATWTHGWMQACIHKSNKGLVCIYTYELSCMVQLEVAAWSRRIPSRV